MADLGNIALWIALLIGLWGSAGAFGGRVERRPALPPAPPGGSGAPPPSRNLPVYYTWSAFYAGQKGSLLLWAIVVASFGSVALLVNRGKYRDLMPYVAGVVSVVVTFFVAAMVFSSNPFERLGF